VAALPYCNNSAAKGYTIKRFPRNPERQIVWVKNINREDEMNGVSTNNLLFCEVNTFEFFIIR